MRGGNALPHIMHEIEPELTCSNVRWYWMNDIEAVSTYSVGEEKNVTHHTCLTLGFINDAYVRREVATKRGIKPRSRMTGL
jgi:hypothetical protein